MWNKFYQMDSVAVLVTMGALIIMLFVIAEIMSAKSYLHRLDKDYAASSTLVQAINGVKQQNDKVGDQLYYTLFICMAILGVLMAARLMA